jgi:hypothetical protein
MNVLELEVMSNGSNVALGKAVKVSALGTGAASYAVDGLTGRVNSEWWNNTNITGNNLDAWLQVDLAAGFNGPIDSVSLLSARGYSVAGATVFVSNSDMSGLSWNSINSLAALQNQGVTSLGKVPDVVDVNSTDAYVFTAKGKVFTDTTPTFSGLLGTSLGSADVVGVYVDGVRLGSATVSGSGASTTWSYTPATALATGDHTIKVAIEQGAGGTAMLGRTDSFTIVTTATQSVLSVAAIASNSDPTGAATVSGLLSAAFVAGQKLAIYDGAESANNLLGYASALHGQTTFTYSASGLGAGVHTLTVRVLNVDGTASSGSAGTAAFTVTAGAPTQTVTVLGGYETTGAYATTGAGVFDLTSGNGTVSSGDTQHRFVTGDSTPGMYGRLSSVLGTNETLKAYVYGVEVAGTLNVAGLNWNFTPTTGLSEGYHDLTFKVVNTVAATSGAGSAAYRVEVDAVASNFASISLAGDYYGVHSGNLASGDVSDAPRITLWGSLAQTDSGLVKVYEVVNGSDVLMGSSTVTNSANWSFTTDALSTGSHVYKAVFANTAGVVQSATASTFAVDHQAQDGVVTNLQTAAGVDTASLTYNKQTLDFTKLGTSVIDKVDLGSFGGNTVKLSTADVLDAGTGLFTTAKGWTFANAADSTHAGTYHQMLMSGSGTTTFGASTVQIAEAANTSNTNPWALTGTASNAGSTYNVYTNLATNNAQLLIDQNLAVSNVVL